MSELTIPVGTQIYDRRSYSVATIIQTNVELVRASSNDKVEGLEGITFLNLETITVPYILDRMCPCCCSIGRDIDDLEVISQEEIEALTNPNNKVIPFTEFAKPNGREIPVYVSRPQSVYDKAIDLIRASYSLHIEVLTTGDIHGTIFDSVDQEDVASFVCENNSAVLSSVDELIMNFEIPEERTDSVVPEGETIQ